jgi:inner membrane protein involved in colicin E2 resistance
MDDSDSEDRLEPFETLGVDILGFAFLIFLLIVLAVVVYVAFEEATWYLPDEAVAVLAGLIGFYLLVANEKIRKALREWLRD